MFFFLQNKLQSTERNAQINVDAAFKPLIVEAVMWTVARGHAGDLVATLSQTTSLCQSVEEAEAKAMLASLQYTWAST
jgi:hypothetical protein